MSPLLPCAALQGVTDQRGEERCQIALQAVSLEMVGRPLTTRNIAERGTRWLAAKIRDPAD